MLVIVGDCDIYLPQHAVQMFRLIHTPNSLSCQTPTIRGMDAHRSDGPDDHRVRHGPIPKTK